MVLEGKFKNGGVPNCLGQIYYSFPIDPSQKMLAPAMRQLLAGNNMLRNMHVCESPVWRKWPEISLGKFDIECPVLYLFCRSLWTFAQPGFRLGPFALFPVIAGSDSEKL